MKLGILDACLIQNGQTAGIALRQTVEIARRAEHLGYSRYWLTEHHSDRVAQASPELLIPSIAASTKSIRVGTAGILLPLYQPLKVANDFHLLSCLFPGRVDLGIGRGLPSAERIHALTKLSARELLLEVYSEKVCELLQYLRGESKIKPLPIGAFDSDVWILGSSASGANLAAKHGTAYSHSLFLSSFEDHSPLLAEYTEKFRPSSSLKDPIWNVAVAGCCAETEQQARRNIDAYEGLSVFTRVVGSPNQCAEMLYEISTRYCTDEVIFLNMTPDFDSKVGSFELLAEAAQLLNNAS